MTPVSCTSSPCIAHCSSSQNRLPTQKDTEALGYVRTHLGNGYLVPDLLNVASSIHHSEFRNRALSLIARAHINLGEYGQATSITESIAEDSGYKFSLLARIARAYADKDEYEQAAGILQGIPEGRGEKILACADIARVRAEHTGNPDHLAEAAALEKEAANHIKKMNNHMKEMDDTKGWLFRLKEACRT